MFNQDLIEELKNYPGLSTVFIEVDGEIHRLSDVSEIYVRSSGEWGGMQPPYREAGSSADEYGVILV